MIGKNFILCFVLVLVAVSNAGRTNSDVVINQHERGQRPNVVINQNGYGYKYGDRTWKTNKINWKECAWNNVNDGRDAGVVRTCSFKKKSSNTYLQVVVTTSTRIYNCDGCCMRWFVSFDGRECSPVPIDVVVYMYKGKGGRLDNLHRPRVIRGNCLVKKTGLINVQLQVGKCRGYGQFDAYTGWNSATRIYLEEVDPPQK